MPRYDRTPRIRGRKLQRERERLFRRQPLCVMCEAKGLIRAATQRDHIIPLCKGGTDAPDNIQALCDDCHAAKTRIDLGRKPAIGVDGWPIV